MFERFTRNARVAVMLAQEEARELTAHEVGPEHLLVGVLQSAGRELAATLAGFGLTAEVVRERLATPDPEGQSFEDDAEALRAIGIDLKAVRDSVAHTFGRDAFDDSLRKSGRRRRRRGHLRFTRSAKKALELSLREALVQGDKEIGCEYLLLGILRGGDRRTLGLITEHVYLTQLRGSVIALLDKAA